MIELLNHGMVLLIFLGSLFTTVNFQPVGEMPVQMGAFKLKSCDPTLSSKALDETTLREK